MPDAHDRGPARRGRKDPELAAQLAMEPQDLNDEDDQEPGVSLVVEGDIITCKITHEVPIIPGHSSFFSYGHGTRVQPGEDEEDVFVRVANNVHEKVGRLILAAQESYEAELAERRTRPIQYQE